MEPSGEDRKDRKDRPLFRTAVLNSARSVHRPKPISLIRKKLNDILKQNEILRQQLTKERHLNNLLQQTRVELKNAIKLYSQLLEKTELDEAACEKEKETMKKMIKHLEKILGDSTCKLKETLI